MNLTAVDLNLLVAFEALYATRSVTAAALRLNRAQPSVSNALGRLRTLFGDALFVRSRDGMQPTARADALMPVVAAALEQIRQALALGLPFDPAQAEGRRLTVAASDYADIVLIPHLVSRLRREAPGVDLQVVSIDRGALYRQLDDGLVDIAVGGHLAPPKRMLRETLYREDFVCIADHGHPRLQGQGLDLPAYLELPHALFVPSNDGSRRGVVDVQLEKLGLRRRVAATFAHVVALPYAVQGSDLVATLAARVAARLAPNGVGIWPLPQEMGDLAFDIDMVYSRRTRDEGIATWLRQCVRSAVQDMPPLRATRPG